jgi:riboflavin synthase
MSDKMKPKITVEFGSKEMKVAFNNWLEEKGCELFIESKWNKELGEDVMAKDFQLTRESNELDFISF